MRVIESKDLLTEPKDEATRSSVVLKSMTGSQKGKGVEVQTDVSPIGHGIQVQTDFLNTSSEVQTGFNKDLILKN